MEKELIKIINEIVEKLNENNCKGCEAGGYFVSDESTPVSTRVCLWLEIENKDIDGDEYTETIEELYVFENQVFIVIDGTDGPFAKQTEFFKKSILEGMKRVLEAVKKELP